MGRPSTPPGQMLVTLTVDDLRTLFREELAAQRSAPATPDQLPTVLTIGEAAKALRQSASTVRRLITTGRLQAVRTGTGGSKILVPRTSVDRLLREGIR